MDLQCTRLVLPVLTAVGRMLLARDGGRPAPLCRSLRLASQLVHAGVDAAVAAQRAHADAAAEGGSAGPDGGSEKVAFSLVAWERLRVVMQAACLCWIFHTHTEVIALAAQLLSAFDTPAALAYLPSPSGCPPLRSLLSPSWGVDGNGVAREVEAFLSAAFGALYPSILLFWHTLAEQVAHGPRLEPHPAGGGLTEALRLWTLQLTVLCRCARWPLAAYNVAGTLSDTVAGEPPLLDRCTGTRGATDDDVEALLARAMRWLLSGSALAHAHAHSRAALQALHMAHPSVLPVVLRHLKQVRGRRWPPVPCQGIPHSRTRRSRAHRTHADTTSKSTPPLLHAAGGHRSGATDGAYAWPFDAFLPHDVVEQAASFGSARRAVVHTAGARLHSPVRRYTSRRALVGCGGRTCNLCGLALHLDVPLVSIGPGGHWLIAGRAAGARHAC